MSPSLDPKYVPKEWRSAYTLALFAAVILTAAGVAAAAVRWQAGAVIEQKWTDTLRAEVTGIAKTAAVDASRDAVTQVARETIAPLVVKVDALKERVDRHEPADDERVRNLREQVAACCAVTPRGPYSAAPAASGGH